MQDAKHAHPGASGKGKAREDSHWQLGWWELHPLIDQAKRPVAWSRSSIIFSAHPTQPLVLARHFSSSRQFVIPSPGPLVTSPTSYDPPTVISISPSGDWLFAYFPGRGGDGVACLWKRAFQLDSWSVRDFWTTPLGAGIVTAAWTNHSREWVINDAGQASRSPPRGPNVPVNSSVLLLITQAQFINACFLPPYVPSLKILKAPLMFPSKVKDNEPTPVEFLPDKPGAGGRRICVSAAIGFCYNDTAFLVATRSHLLPSHRPPSADAMDIGLPIDLTRPDALDERLSCDSEIWGEELVIDVCEVGIQIDHSNALNLGTRPLPPVFHAHPHLTDLSFFAIPPESPASLSPNAKSPSLDVDEQWESSLLLSTSDRAGRDTPAGVAISQNRALVCCMSPSNAPSARTSVHPLPRRRAGLVVPASTVQETPKGDLSRALCLALMSRESPSDIIHVLTLPSTSLHNAVTTLYNTLCILAANANGLAEMWLVEMLGVITEVYLGKARYSQGTEKANLTAQWKTAHDVCSMEALNTAFEDCQDGDAYDLDAIWQLVGLSTWFIDFLERLLKDCVAFNDETVSLAEVNTENGEKADDSPTPLPTMPAASPILIHAIHPYFFKHMLTAIRHVKRFRDHIGRLSAKGENTQIAKDVLMDAIDCSGIHLDAMIPLLTEIMQIIKAPPDHLRRCLTLCAPIPAVLPYLKQSVEKIVNSKVIDRPKLFIKASDLVDGVSQMSLTDHYKTKDTDVVTKGLLLGRGTEMCCVRCGGKSDLGDGKVAGHISRRWRQWEMMWATRCVCGGGWTRSTSS
ncbi:hypothetical protein EUX98_g7717 [Antrodiella citrinella]|uniref:Mediator complex subunit 16 C-terminal domain-containing protein n=1 Tax=Antrodiella citrinella TaxID=2447956 RepID=A0A4S4MKT6_9APHY|nr:hypothetical protein EUX98_g7717 [Antrodiella citrinella]